MTDPGAPDDGGFPAAVTRAVLHHMNADHGDDMVLICSALGGVDAVTSASMTGVDRYGADFSAISNADSQRSVDVRIPWSRKLTERAEIRAELVRIVTEAQPPQRG